MANQLTSRDKEYVREIFQNFAINAGDNMILYYKILISNTPEYKKMFDPIKGCPLSEIHKNDWLRYELGPVMGATFVSIIHEMDDLKAMRQVIGRIVNMPQHIECNLLKKDYQKALEALTKTFQLTISSDYLPQEAVQSWIRVASLILQIFDDEVRKASNTTQQIAQISNSTSSTSAALLAAAAKGKRLSVVPRFTTPLPNQKQQINREQSFKMDEEPDEELQFNFD